jgi:hypothetical protein
MAVLYRHLKPCGEVFYIGIGKTEKRPYSKLNRNKWWKNVVNNYDYEVQILKKGLTWEEAYELEIILISHYGRQDLGLGTLVNLTNGGDGFNGCLFLRTEGDKVINTQTKEIFNSMAAAARSINMNFPSFQRRMNGTAKNNTPFVLLKNYKEGEDIKFNHYIKYICTKTFKTFTTIKECGDYLGVNSKTLSVCLNPDRRERNSTTIMPYEDYLKYGIIPPHVITKLDLAVINRETKEIYNSTGSAAKILGIERTKFYKMMKGKQENTTDFMLLSEYEKLTESLVKK